MLSIGGLTLSFICKTLLLTGLLLALSWLSGCSAERLFRLTLAPAERPAVGFVLLMACGEIVGWPVVAFRLSSALFMALVGAAAAALRCLGFSHGCAARRSPACGRMRPPRGVSRCCWRWRRLRSSW